MLISSQLSRQLMRGSTVVFVTAGLPGKRCQAWTGIDGATYQTNQLEQNDGRQSSTNFNTIKWYIKYILTYLSHIFFGILRADIVTSPFPKWPVDSRLCFIHRMWAIGWDSLLRLLRLWASMPQLRFPGVFSTAKKILEHDYSYVVWRCMKIYSTIVCCCRGLVSLSSKGFNLDLQRWLRLQRIFVYCKFHCALCLMSISKFLSARWNQWF